MIGLNELKKKIRENLDFLREKYKVKTIGIFGSYSRGEQRRKSDVDILVEFSEVIDLFTFVELENFLSDLLGVKVDLVMKDTLKPRIRERILSEVIYV